ncbi:hypothetical protein EDC01DRAFT_633455 [Geopyxis carbonaria]|nr:hypothetical protein EDC01DRAFT_633455 [Geopyxis carbonaria]
MSVLRNSHHPGQHPLKASPKTTPDAYAGFLTSSSMSRRPIKPAVAEPPPLATAPEHLHLVDDAKDDGAGLLDDDDALGLASPPPAPAPASKKRKAKPPAAAVATGSGAAAAAAGQHKRPRTNTPWTAAEELRLKNMRDAGNSWSEIAKTFPTRTEGSVKKHWYKDMHYAEFGEDESTALLAAIKEYDANKWKVIGQKVGKPAKACEQYAKEHFAGK